MLMLEIVFVMFLLGMLLGFVGAGVLDSLSHS